MNVKRLKEMLNNYDDDDDVCAFDADSNDWTPITGILHCPGDDPPSIYMQTDDND